MIELDVDCALFDSAAVCRRSGPWTRKFGRLRKCHDVPAAPSLFRCKRPAFHSTTQLTDYGTITMSDIDNFGTVPSTQACRRRCRPRRFPVFRD
ncbi:uncharacterized protein PITG_16620 [Phytophthora infestans T30-4]|uniref:Uncharacterized protein n=1 Tax=Phytophthora infestans (strain T30-4) TaxID=403677 RepID=D0NUT3_PHYIT|nr:uncharacterized protein PITG_16620 [Phytophthora infestans T30-4]EEY65444.1 hypothetical protein PITG_16620 [Phytophthora infestans T30-4]|eukprot:XP_002897162.1 hypothetical protein PITG_16620 [Phytophthora infestans T30-4]